jgi:hypothetical protein
MFHFDEPLIRGGKMICTASAQIVAQIIVTGRL